MNLNKNKIFLFLVPVILLASCKKKLEEAYLNPNAPTVVPIETLLPGVIGSMVGASSGTGVSGGVAGDALVIGRYIQYWGDNNGQANANFLYDEMGGPVFTSGTLATIWNGFYFGQGQNVNQIITWGTEQKKWDYVGVAWAIRAWGWLELANEYADGIIVKEAFNTSLQQFDYDPQSLAYDTCRATCMRALAYLNKTGDGVSQTNLAIGDAYMNQGDLGKWKKFVYGVLARSYGYLSNKAIYTSGGFADSTIKYCNLAQTSNADNTTAKFSGNVNVSGQNSYYGPTRGNVGGIRQGAYIVNLMSGLNSAIPGVTDPRIWYMLRQNLSGKFAGITPWLGNGGPGFSTSATDPNFPPDFWGNTTLPQSTSAPTGATVGTLDSGRYLFRNVAEFPLMTASEMQFLLAEAAYHKGDKATALTAYVNAISLHFDMLSANYSFNIPAAQAITPTSKAAYLAAVTPATPGALTLTQIMLQKYIALYGWGPHETWVDMRKYHYNKDLDPTSGNPVYADFTPPAGTFLYINNNNKLVYRAKPQNVEYTYDIPSLTKVGATNLDYHTQECWFSLP